MIVSVSNFLRVAHIISCIAIIVLASVQVPLCVMVWDTFRHLENLVYVYVTYIPAAIAATSLALFVLSLVGVWAAAVGSAASFNIYTSSLLFVLLGKIMWAVLAFDLHSDFIQALNDAFDWYMERYQLDPSVMDEVQWKMKCCGKDTPSDWFSLTGYIPPSCCHGPDSAHQYAECMAPEQLYLVPPRGCLRYIEDMPRHYYTIMQIMFNVSCVILVFSLVVSYFMGRACSRCEREYFRIKNNILQGKSAYEVEDKSMATLLRRKLKLSSLTERKKESFKTTDTQH